MAVVSIQSQADAGLVSQPLDLGVDLVLKKWVLDNFREIVWEGVTRN